MIALECKPSPRLIKLEILKRRLPTFHPKWGVVADDLKDWNSGYLGEKALGFYLDMLPEKEYLIFYGLRLKYRKFYFQIDCLLLCSKFCLVMESKNWSGDICFDKNFDQVTVVKKGKKNRRKNPVKQAKLQSIKLKAWLEEQHVPELPIHYLYVNTNETSEIISDEYIRNACNTEMLLDKINQLQESYKLDKLEPKDLRKIQNLLLANHTPDDPDILKEYQISENEILTGVWCPKCSALPMKYTAGYWCCSDTGHKSKTAHYQALQEYFLLIKSTITNRELRWFLQIKSMKVASTILTGMNLPFKGTYKDRVYYLPDSLDFFSAIHA